MIFITPFADLWRTSASPSIISQRFMPDFHAVFRNSGFVIGTLIMRLSLSAPWPWNIASSIFAAVFVLALTWATTYFGPSRLRKPLPR